MKKIAMALLPLLALAVALPIFAGEEEDQGMLARNYYLEAKSGHEQEFEAALKKQVAWYEANNEEWPWHTWQWETGEKFGQYVFRSFGHQWKDMDERSERGARARAHFMEVVSPHLESISASIGKVLPNLSHWPEELGMVPMVSAYEFKLHYGKSEEFVHVISKIHKAILDSSWPVHYSWGVTVSGGEVPTFWLFVPLKNWADMKEPEKSFRAMLEETIGRAETESVMASLRDCIREEHSGLVRLRPELSYMPGADK